MGEGIAHFIRRKAVSAGLLPIGGAGKATVLMYHGVCPLGKEPITTREVRQTTFRRHLELFREHFHVIALEELFNGKRHDEKLTIALTFDDGLRNNLSQALPLLEEFNTPATFFITGANECGITALWGDLLAFAEKYHDAPIQLNGVQYSKSERGSYADASGKTLKQAIKDDGGSRMKQELTRQLQELHNGVMQDHRHAWELLSDQEIIQLNDHPLITIGAHGYRHTEMGSTSVEASISELRSMKAYFEQLLGKAPKFLAWPSGSYNMHVVEEARDLGFEIQLAVTLKDPTDLRPGLLLPRYGMFEYPSNERFYLHEVASAGL